MIETVEKQLNELAIFVQNAIKDEIAQQGHRDTGKLIDSVSYEFEHDETEDVLRICFSWLKYGVYVDRGVKPQNVPFGGGTGKTSKYIQGLIAWAKRKGFDKPVSAAFAIAHTHRKEGIPSKGSYRFSNNGRRKAFTKHALAASENKVRQMLEDGTIQALSIVFDNLIEQTPNQREGR